MARDFTVGGQALNATSTVSINSNNLTTVSIWARINNSPGVGAFTFMLGNTSSGHLINHAAASTNIGYGWGGNGVVADTGLWTAGVWTHWLITTPSGVDGLYIGGVNVANNNPGFIGPQTVTASCGGVAGQVFGGQLADFALWDGIILSAGEIKALAAGARPWTIRPGNLKWYYPIDGLQSPEPDLSGRANNGVLNGSPALAAGPPFMPFTPRWQGFTLPPPPPPPILMPQIVIA